MRNYISAASCSAIVAAATISLMAQAPAQQSTTTASTDQKVTVTGCLKAAPVSTDTSTATGTTGTAGTTAAPNPTDAANARYVLTDAAASLSTESATQSAPAGATSATTTSKESAQTYRLIANPTALAPHVGKKLELTGTIVDAASAASASTDQAASGSGPILRVESGKIVGASCHN